MKWEGKIKQYVKIIITEEKQKKNQKKKEKQENRRKRHDKRYKSAEQQIYELRELEFNETINNFQQKVEKQYVAKEMEEVPEMT